MGGPGSGNFSNNLRHRAAPVELDIRKQQEGFLDDPEWEYEYDEEETEDFYFTLDLTTHVPDARVKKHYAPNGRKTAKPTGFQTPAPEAEDAVEADHDPDKEGVADTSEPPVPASNGATPGEPDGIVDPQVSVPTDMPDLAEQDAKPPGKLQILGLHTANPVITFNNAFYSCYWMTDLGTELYISRPGVVDEPKRAGYVLDVIGLSRARLVGKPATLTKRKNISQPNGSTPGTAIDLGEGDEEQGYAPAERSSSVATASANLTLPSSGRHTQAFSGHDKPTSDAAVETASTTTTGPSAPTAGANSTHGVIKTVSKEEMLEYQKQHPGVDFVHRGLGRYVREDALKDDGGKSARSTPQSDPSYSTDSDDPGGADGPEEPEVPDWQRDPSVPLTVPPHKIKNDFTRAQASFLERLSRMKLAKGDKDKVPMFASKQYSMPANAEEIKQAFEAADRAAGKTNFKEVKRKYKKRKRVFEEEEEDGDYAGDGGDHENASVPHTPDTQARTRDEAEIDGEYIPTNTYSERPRQKRGGPRGGRGSTSAMRAGLGIAEQTPSQPASDSIAPIDPNLDPALAAVTTPAGSQTANNGTARGKISNATIKAGLGIPTKRTPTPPPRKPTPPPKKRKKATPSSVPNDPNVPKPKYKAPPQKAKTNFKEAEARIAKYLAHPEDTSEVDGTDATANHGEPEQMQIDVEEDGRDEQPGVAAVRADVLHATADEQGDTLSGVATVANDNERDTALPQAMNVVEDAAADTDSAEPLAPAESTADATVPTSGGEEASLQETSEANGGNMHDGAPELAKIDYDTRAEDDGPGRSGTRMEAAETASAESTVNEDDPAEHTQSPKTQDHITTMPEGG